VSRKLGTGLETLRLVAADTRRGKEVFFGLDAYAAYQKEYGLIAWRASGEPCRRARTLFRYSGKNARPRPRGADDGPVTNFQVTLKDFSARYAGKEIRLREDFQDENDPECCPTIHRLTSYRYHRGRDRYVAYDTSVRRDG
jgi:hypothetical protein